MRPQPPLFTDNNHGQKRIRAEGEELSEEIGAKRPRRDLSVADEVDEILRLVENRDHNTEKAAGTPAQNKRKRPVKDDDDEIMELPPKKTKLVEIVELTDD